MLFSRNVGLALVVILLYTLTSLSNSSLVPNFLGTVGQLRPEQTGELLLVYGALPMLVMVPLSIFLLRHVDPRVVLIIGLSAFAAANLLGTQLTHDWALRRFRHRSCILQSIGQAFTLLPIIIIALSNSDFTRATAFAAYIQVMRLGGAEIGVALMGTWLRVREQIHSNFLGQHVGERQRRRHPNSRATVGELCQPRRRDRAGARPGIALGAGAARGQCAGLYRRLLADVLACDRRARLCRPDDQGAAGPFYACAVRRACARCRWHRDARRSMGSGSMPTAR